MSATPLADNPEEHAETNADLWLDDDQMRAWLATVAATEALLAAIDAQLKTEMGMNRFEYSILAMLSASPTGELTMSELAAAAFGSLSRLSHAVGRLEDRGWVERAAANAGRTRTVARLTDPGRNQLARAAPGHVRQVRRMLVEPLSADQFRTLGDICTAILQATEPDRLHALDRIMTRLED